MHSIEIIEDLRNNRPPRAVCSCGELRVTRSTVPYLMPIIAKHTEATGHELKKQE
jgi:hypothetical protein